MTLATEHKAVLDTMRELEREGFEVSVLPVQQNGLVDPAAFEAALRPETAPCGDVMRLQIRINGQGVIEDARFKTYGCGSASASSSLVTEWVKGKTLDEAMAIRNTQIAEALALPPVKIHCSIL
ncbi:aminotransferase class V-fold PLP-dependent enzyme, partial [Paraburkholderia tropica]|uniref:aminotransferase class V-fold PLP-dependent enzyme n=1 Tax=Paraburkholderia tropica TaxID=92647 RepID=UPI0030173F09